MSYNSDILILKRMIQNSEDELFPRMKNRKEYIDHLLKDNPNIPSLEAERQLNELQRKHIQLLMNYVIYMEDQIKNFKYQETDDSEYVKVLEKELLHDFREKHNIVK